jgi:hypothetical protein
MDQCPKWAGILSLPPYPGKPPTQSLRGIIYSRIKLRERKTEHSPLSSVGEIHSLARLISMVWYLFKLGTALPLHVTLRVCVGS